MAVTPTYVPLGTIELSSTDSEIVFSSIPATYRDLIVVCDFKVADGNNKYFSAQFNGSTASIYSNVVMGGTGSSTFSAAYTFERYGAPGFPQNNVSTTAVMQIMDYSTTDKHKTMLVRHNPGGANVEAQATRWASTDAINSVKLFFSSATNFSIGSTFSLFGIA